MSLETTRKGMAFKFPNFWWAKTYGGQVGIVAEVGEGAYDGMVRLTFASGLPSAWFWHADLIEYGDRFWTQPKIPVALHISSAYP
jgi:hypothetical protein